MFYAAVPYRADLHALRLRCQRDWQPRRTYPQGPNLVAKSGFGQAAPTGRLHGARYPQVVSARVATWIEGRSGENSAAESRKSVKL